MKRRLTNDVLTGGSKDVNPQFLAFSATVGPGLGQTTSQVNLPQSRIGAAPTNKAMVMEWLKIFVESPQVDQETFTIQVHNSYWAISTVNFGTSLVDLGTPGVIMAGQDLNRAAFNAGGSANVHHLITPQVIDLTDGAGHGFLVATDNIFVQVDTDGFTLQATFAFRVLYRFKEVSLVEYIGIVQSQQG